MIIITYHGQVKHGSGVDGHRGKNGSNHIAHNGDSRLVRPIDIVSVILVGNDRSFSYVDVHVLEGVRPVAQVKQHRLVPELRQTISLNNKGY